MNVSKTAFINRLVSAKKSAESSLQGVGKRIAKNVSQGQKNLSSGKMKTYGAINPFAK